MSFPPNSRLWSTIGLTALFGILAFVLTALLIAAPGAKISPLIAGVADIASAIAVIAALLDLPPVSSALRRMWNSAAKTPVVIVASLFVVVSVVTGIASLGGGPATVSTPTPTPSLSLGGHQTPNVSLTSTPFTPPTNTPFTPPTNTPFTLPTNTSVAPTATPIIVAAYQATVPGGKCDSGGARWQEAGGAQISCTPTSMELEHIPNTGLVTEEFLGNGGSFSTNYNVAVTISNIGAQACPGIVYRGSPQGLYLAVICDGGSCQLLRYDPTGIVNVSSVSVPTASSYRMSVALGGSHHSIAINGIVVISVDDSTYLTTQTLGLSGFIFSNSAIIADFSNFAFAPLS